jgi:hypothetical protein
MAIQTVMGDMEPPAEHMITVTIRGNEMEIPALVPLLTDEEAETVRGGGMSAEIIEKAMDWAEYRMHHQDDDDEEYGKPWR